MMRLVPEPEPLSVRPTWLDRGIAWIAPRLAARRMEGRLRFAVASHAAGLQTRLDRDWRRRTTTDKGPRKTATGLQRLQDRAVDLVETNAVADGLIARCVDNVVGTGMTLQVRTEDSGWNAEAEARFNAWFDQEADVSGLSGATEQQDLMTRGHLVLGDALTILLADGRLQHVDAGLLATPWDQAANENIVDGIEKDRHGRPIRFWFLTEPRRGAQKFEAVDARDVVHWPRRFSVSDARGRSVFANTARYFDMIDANIEAVIAAAQMAAMTGLVFKRKSLDALPTLGTTAAGDGTSRPAFEMEPGMVHWLEDGEDIEQLHPTQPSVQWPDFLAVILRILGLPVGLPLELMLLDFSRTNYSSARASLLQAYRSFKRVQAGLARRLSRIYRWRISKFIKAGALPPRDDAWRHDWRAQGWPWVDPVKEVVGNLAAIDAGFGTVRDVIAGLGGDWEDVFTRRREELARMRESGIPIRFSRATQEEPRPASESRRRPAETQETADAGV